MTLKELLIRLGNIEMVNEDGDTNVTEVSIDDLGFVTVVVDEDSPPDDK